MRFNVKKLSSNKNKNVGLTEPIVQQNNQTPRFTKMISKFGLNTPTNQLTSPTSDNLKSSIKMKASDSASKLTNMLLSIKTTKMKRTNHKNLIIHPKITQPSTTCLNCANSNICSSCFNNNLDDIDGQHLNFRKEFNKSDKNLKKISLKAIGVSFANLFKPNKRIGRNNQIVVVEEDNREVYYPENNQRVHFSVKNVFPQEETPKLAKKSVRIETYTPKLPSSCPKFSQNFSKSTTALNEDDCELKPRKTQPSMGLKAYTLKNKKNVVSNIDLDSGSVKMDVANQNPETKRERFFKHKSMVFKNESNNNDHIYMNTVSDTNLMRDVKFDQDMESIYESLDNYESNQIYFEISDNLRSNLKETKEQNQEQEQDAFSLRSSMETLVPFLDSSRSTLMQPILSSTSRSLEQADESSIDSQSSNFPIRMQPTPLRISAVSKTKKIRSLNEKEFISQFGISKQDRNENILDSDV